MALPLKAVPVPLWLVDGLLFAIRERTFKAVGENYTLLSPAK
jgi:hypothetical protein